MVPANPERIKKGGGTKKNAGGSQRRQRRTNHTSTNNNTKEQHYSSYHGRSKRSFTPAQFANRIRVAAKNNKRKRTRPYKQLRPCVLPMTFLVPLLMILLERYLGYQFQLEDVQTIYYEQLLGVNPWDRIPPPSLRVGTPPDLFNLTKSHGMITDSNNNPASASGMTCPLNQQRMNVVHNPNHWYAGGRKIPTMVHQTSKTRCMTRHFFRATFDWVFRPFWSFYFHDDEAVDRLLLETPFPEFPTLHHVVQHCCTSRASKVALWRLLVLWCYGGMHVDLNTFPTSNFTSTTIKANDDGVFFWEEGLPSGNESTERILSTKVVAVAPYHPLLYYAIQEYLSQVVYAGSRSLSPDEQEPVFEVPMHRVWQKALVKFTQGSRQHHAAMRGRDGGQDGVIMGTQGRSIRILGTVGGEESYFSPLFISEKGLSGEFQKMGMDRIGAPNVSSTCLRDMMKPSPG